MQFTRAAALGVLSATAYVALSAVWNIRHRSRVSPFSIEHYYSPSCSGRVLMLSVHSEGSRLESQLPVLYQMI